jgi:hypothetical protein
MINATASAYKNQCYHDADDEKAKTLTYPSLLFTRIGLCAY